MVRSVSALVAALVVAVTAACTSTITGTAQPNAGDAAAAAAEAAAAFPDVLSTTTADTGRTVTATELLGEVAVSDVGAPQGFRTQSVVVSGGFGSFQVALPPGYVDVWRAGTPYEGLLTVATRLDPVWAADARGRLAGAAPDGALRAMTVDATRTEVRMVQVTLTPSEGRSGEQLVEVFDDLYTEQGNDVREARTVTVNGAQGAYIEFSIATFADTEPRIAMQVLVPDPPNDLLWGVTCDVPEAEVDVLRPLCGQIASTFRPLPGVSG